MRKVTLLLTLCLLATALAFPQSPNPFGYPVVPDMTADASITEFDGVFYYYATTDGYGQGLARSGPPTVWKSTDFVHWSFCGTYFPSAKDQIYWAPSKAVKRNGKYYIFPTINSYMYPAVADSPEGPFRLAKGEDRFEKPYTASTLLSGEDPSGIDAEIFVDDDGQPYVFFGKRRMARLSDDMTSIVGDVHEIATPRGGYSEGPIFFKRKGIYYYLYTLDGNENYQYAYVYSRVSPFGPYESAEQDIITTTDRETGVYGPGHGCVFNVEGTDDYYIAYLEFGRRETNRQTYVNRLEFNDDGTIRPVKLDLNGVGALRKPQRERKIEIAELTASSVQDTLFIAPIKDPLCQRKECFDVAFAADGSNGSRWKADEAESEPWIVADLGRTRRVGKSAVCFVRPTMGHAYRLETSKDGQTWTTVSEQLEAKSLSPHVDKVRRRCRYLRITILSGETGIWEWTLSK